MKKALVLILTLALVLAMGATAFAANSTGVPVQLKADNTQISVTVPAAMVGTVDATTGTITFATTGSIENTSVIPIKVSAVTCTAATGWTLASESGSENNTIVAKVQPNSGTAVDLLTASPTITGTDWNMTAKDAATGSGTDCIALTFTGSVYKLTNVLTATEATAFTVVFTVEAGANS